MSSESESNAHSYARLNRVVAQLCAGSQGAEPTLPTLQYVELEKKGRVGIIRMNRPKQFNALSDALVSDIVAAVRHFNSDATCGCIILTGNGKAFAAGADIKEMMNKSFYEMSTRDKIAPFDAIAASKLPIIAAVNGLALGGGCEIAMMCDIIYAAESAQFGQPEIVIGTIPGAGGTQRLTRAVGKSKAMEIVLTGKRVSAQEAERMGLVAAVVPDDKLLETAMATAAKIASHSRPMAILAKEAVNAAFESSLAEGCRLERRLFMSTFALKDQKEGMRAFAERRQPNFTHE